MNGKYKLNTCTKPILKRDRRRILLFIFLTNNLRRKVFFSLIESYSIAECHKLKVHLKQGTGTKPREKVSLYKADLFSSRNQIIFQNFYWNYCHCFPLKFTRVREVPT